MRLVDLVTLLLAGGFLLLAANIIYHTITGA